MFRFERSSRAYHAPHRGIISRGLPVLLTTVAMLGAGLDIPQRLRAEPPRTLASTSGSPAEPAAPPLATPTVTPDRDLPILLADRDAQAATSGAAAAELEQLQLGWRAWENQARFLRQLVHSIRPAVVHITAEIKESEGPHAGQVVEEAGAGVVVKFQDRHFVLTNCHVVEEAAVHGIRLRTHDGREVRPRQVLTDPESDVALLVLPAEQWAVARLAPAGSLQVGDYVLAIGSPFGLSHSVTQGIVSAVGRSDLELGSSRIRIQDFIQTDAAINPGNSGGPLFDLRGQVVGINTAIASDSGVNAGIGFTIPIAIARRVAEQLAEEGTIRRGYLGVEMDAQFDRHQVRKYGLPSPGGARVVSVKHDSPADRAGMQAGDVVWMFNDQTIRTDQQLVNAVALAPVDRPLSVFVYRQQKPLQLAVTLQERKKR